MEQNIGLIGLLIAIPLLVLMLLPFWKMWRRTGHGVLISLLMTWLSVLGLIVLAFKSWPIDRNKG
ncbi:hypothetical protein [Tritonibacter mobilis]|uniref:Uncharacterized protein n=1 Tax=Tritonibacter mobilis F1926 TaxID=1265309 RepID=A0A1B1A360_9RHOB|nr:hypothetical protein [Tritonibacter mobilis]ANP41013.1 hypothetical protein K529_009595 [Tritonibacter mobilis F1926]KJZ24504.1 hypothetical protein TW79_09085 [Tritonibacter mobilis]MBU3035889.1 hypothetical protein [Tritonibacter mobilis]WHQ81467.1 hypothetical protein OMR53_09670 [Tritonibacter mobilis]